MTPPFSNSFLIIHPFFFAISTASCFSRRASFLCLIPCFFNFSTFVSLAIFSIAFSDCAQRFPEIKNSIKKKTSFFPSRNKSTKFICFDFTGLYYQTKLLFFYSFQKLLKQLINLEIKIKKPGESPG